MRRMIFSLFGVIHRISQWSRKKFTSAGSLILMGIIFAGVFGVDTRQTLSFQIFALLLSLFMVSVFFSFYFRGKFTIRRTLPDYCTVGEPMHYRVDINNESRFTQQDLSIVDELTCSMPNYPEFLRYLNLDKQSNWFDRTIGFPRWVKLVQFKRGASIKLTPVDRIVAKSSVSTKLEFTALRRGYIHFKQSSLLRPDPLGLSNAHKTVTQADSLLVLPKRYKVADITLPGSRRYQRGGINHAGSVGDSQEFISLRDYRPGDPIRNVHWRSFAKQSVPIVKEYQDEFFVRMGLILDTFVEDKNELLFEEAVSVAASLIDTPANNDSLLDLMFVGDEAHRFTSDRGVSNLHHMLEILACVNANHEKPFSKLTNLVLRNSSSLSALMCVFLGWDQARQDLVKKLRVMNIPILVLVMQKSSASEDTAHELLPGPMQDQPHRFHVLQQDKVAEQLKQITF